eukprot:847359-Rhodomonas_salina.3
MGARHPSMGYCIQQCEYCIHQWEQRIHKWGYCAHKRRQTCSVSREHTPPGSAIREVRAGHRVAGW